MKEHRQRGSQRATERHRPAPAPAVAKSASKQSPSAYTVRLGADTGQRFEQMRAGRKLRDIGEEAFLLWIHKEEKSAAAAKNEAGTADDLEESLRENLVSAVTDHLRSNTAWAEAAIRAASLMDPVISVFFRRISHFHSEKQALSSAFIPWLVSRVFHHVRGGRDVRLVIESGTTLKVALDHLAPCLHSRAELLEVPPEGIQVLTNNFPGAESYQAYASSARVGDRTLDQLIQCELVPGTALQEYAAVVGAKAEAYLGEWCHPKGNGREVVRIGLAVGNWVMLEGTPARPSPLARGLGHKSFKEEVFKNCDEIYLISPLCKIIRADRRKSANENLADFNSNLKKAAKTPDHKGDYSLVDPAYLRVDESRIKLVTTYRDEQESIVRLHSRLILDALEIVPKATYDEEIPRPYKELEHFAYLHDVHSKKPFEEQLKIELPHRRTRVEWFRKRYFEI